MRGRVLAIAAACALAVACGIHYATPRHVAHDARFGWLGGTGAIPSRDAMCSHWLDSLARRDPHAARHISFPETNPQAACFTPVRYTNTAIEVGSTPPGCAYPDVAQLERLRTLAADLDALATRPDAPTPILPCGIREPNRTAALEQNARTLRATADRLSRSGAATYPYAAIITFGFGWPDQAETSIADWRPGQGCHGLSQRDIDRLGEMVLRTRRVADALRAGIAPMAIVSGGTQHSRMVEAFAMQYLLECEEGVRADRVLVEPCAEHTHTNFRNSGRWLVAMGARTGYVVTDDAIQREYLNEWTGFEIASGSLDQRSLRDWGYVMGAWRRASMGPNVGYWFTPYRFWAEPRDGLGSFTCLDPGDLGVAQSTAREAP